MGTHTDDRKTAATQNDKPPRGQGHQPLPGENSPGGEGAKRKHVQNADLPPGVGHQPLPGEDPPSKSGK
ncbi:hypothetical protein RDV84_22140 [Lysobacter yananisis]|uniref:Uncharacterized protein n=2 Tax=Lysobacter TaxID=68 RepID=A0A0S2DFR7_LYSEN|nr:MULTISPECIES: hypothetical protein [Lysobacter]ALN57346.1 hypothetical protein GLE_1996 [Lysobacter enzymogenes]QCW25975.1 hypothetical protein FE772_10145 [Lysobacter enzymogenes]WMT02633.1 hypothetical protein RDV84_22140 [Lysobacter yananisis]